jgi:carbonic anhydrase/acetyltransferase-like protein (isoleucine patch superfamily)
VHNEAIINHQGIIMNEQRKYEFVPGDEIVIAPGRTVKRIRALVAIAIFGVAPGELGGYIESEANLSQVSGDAWVSGDAQVSGNAWVSGDAQVSGNAWVSGDARVYGDAWVYGDAQVSGNAWVSGDAQVSGNAWVYGDARVYGDAWVYGDARVYGDAWVYGDARVESRADWLLVGPAKSSGRFTTAYRDSKIGVRVSCGCFSGTAQEFSAQIESTHKNNQEHLQQYRLFCQLIALNFGIEA